MSSGSTTPPKEEVLKTDDFSRDVAKDWCNQVRVKVFGRGLTGVTDKLDKSNVKAHKSLDELDELYPDGMPEHLAKLDKQYKEAVIRMKHLQDDYVSFELAKTNAQNNIEGKKFGLIKSKKRKESELANAKSIENAEKGMNDVHTDLIRETTKLETLANDLALKLKDEKTRRENAEMGLSKDEKTKISNAEKLLKTGNSLIRFFDDCDASTSAGIRSAYGAKTKDDWYATGYDRDALVTDLTDLNSAWQQNKTDYQTGKKNFDKNFALVQKELQDGQEILGDTALNGLLTKFYKGQDAALAKKWNDAGTINPTFLAEVRKAVTDAKGDYDAWMLRKKEYPAIKTKLNTIGDPKFTILALQKLADVTATAEKDRKFAAAVLAFDAAKKEAEDVLAVAEAYPTTRIPLQDQIDALSVEISNLPVAAQSLAKQLLDAASAAILEFDNGRYVKTTDALDTLASKVSTAINGLKTQVEALKDPGKVNEEVAKLKAVSDVTPFIDTLTALTAELKVKIGEYLGYGYDPVGDPTKKTAWELVVTTAENLLTELLQVKKAGTTTKFDELVTNTGVQQTALDTLRTDIAKAVTAGAQTLTDKQGALNRKLNELQTSLKEADHIFTTATWHRDASTELLTLRAAETAYSCAVVDAALDRATKLHAQVTGYTAAKSDMSKKYDALKDRITKVQKALKKSDLKTALPTATAALTEDAEETLTDLRADGPGLVDLNYGSGTPGLAAVAKLETDLLELQQRVVALEQERTKCNTLISELKRDISGVLTEKITAANGNKRVNPASLPIAKSLAELEPRVTAEKIADLQTLQKRLANLKSELTLLLDEEPTALQQIAGAAAEADQEAQDQRDALRKLEGEYNRDLEKYNLVLAEIKKLKGVDKTEKKRLVGLQKDAKKSAKMNDWAGAARKMALALRMAETLQSDPKASEVTGRGNSELKKLNPRWKAGVDLVKSSVAELKAEIEKVCLEDDAVKTDITKVTDPFQQRVVARFVTELKPDMFQQELLALQSEDAKGEAKEKDREKKKKYREQALAKLRRVRDLISRDPIFTSVMMSANPFKKRVAGIQIMRALNDLDLNLQRSV